MSLKRMLISCAFLLTFVTPYAQVNLQTGSAVFSIPMFNWQDHKGKLSSSVTLSYNSGNGLKVNDIASDAGQGWNLVAGGSITRMQVGEPDDQQAREPSNDPSNLDISRYPAGYLYANTPIANGCPGALTKYPIYPGKNQVYSQHNVTMEDKQLDYFSFEFSGKSGIFVLDKSAGIGRMLGDSRIKIRFKLDPTMINDGIRTTITSFSIQDVDGMTYIFARKGKAKVLHADFCDANATQPLTQPKFSAGHVYFQSGFENAKLVNPYVIGNWFLSEVDDSLTNRKITINYNDHFIDNTAGSDISYNQNGDYSIISYKRSIAVSPAISSITYPDGHNVIFNYGSPRQDLNGDSVLASVDVKYQGRSLSKYLLKTSYFIQNRYGTPTTAFQQKASRLCLRSVTKIGVDLKEDTPPYVFDYFLGSDAPDDFVPPSFFYAKDIWGFYNGNSNLPYDIALNTSIPLNVAVSQLNNNQLRGLCFLNKSQIGQVILNAKSLYAKNGLLKQIIYPTGGTLSYQYEQNAGVIPLKSEGPVGGVHVQQTSSTDGGSSNGCANPIVTQYGYNLSGPGTASSLWALEMPVNSTIMGSHYASELKKYHITWSSLPFGECYWTYKYPGILSQMEAVDLVGFQKLMETLGPTLGIVSLVTDVLDVLNLVFVSTGFLAWAAVVVDFVGAVLTLGLTCFSGDSSKDQSYTVYYNTDLNGASPLPTQFKRVEVIENPGTIGKTVHVFTSSDQYGIWVLPGDNKDFSAKQRFAPWAYGLPLSTTVFDKNGNIVKSTTNQYGWTDLTNCDSLGNVTYTRSGSHSGKASLSNPLFLSLCPPKIKVPMNLKSTKCLVRYTYSLRSSEWVKPTVYDDPASYVLSPGNSDLTVDPYDLFTGRLELTATSEKVFSTSDPSKSAETITNYAYNTNNFEVKQISVTQSNGDVIKKYNRYTSDYSGTANTALQSLLRYNIVSLPVSTYSTVSYVATPGTERLLSEKVTEFVQIANGDIRPARILEQRFTQPSTTVSPYSPDNGGNSTIYKVTQTLTYDLASNLAGIQDEGGRAITNVYDYDDKYVVASAINATPIIDKVAYTSFETGSLGGWVISGSVPATVNSAITGTKSFPLSTQSLSAGLNTAKPYTLSFWATSPISVSSGGTLVKSAPTINGFTYYEYDIAQGTSIVTIGGSANIDELRLYPKMARLRTLAYDPLIGKTSECDENNRLTYYEYDNLGRLLFVKDENHSVLKMYEYNNISAAKQNGCPGTYPNHLVTELFTRSNCSPGYVGTDAPYSVPAGRYTSTISQEDADAKAEADLLVQGPITANANGSCLFVYHNVLKTETDSSQSCDEGNKGGFVTYTVPANKYSSLISQADADQQAIDEIAANAQAYANSPDHRICMVDNDMNWVYNYGDPTSCRLVGGVAHTLYLGRDLNPNSPTYNQQSWRDVGPSGGSCPSPLSVYGVISFENIVTLMDGSERADIVVHFYTGVNQPFYVNNLTLGYSVTFEFDNSTGSGSFAGNGTSSVIVYGAPILGPDPACLITQPDIGQFCVLYNYDYVLNPASF